MTSNKSGTTTAPSKGSQSKHSSPVYFSQSLFRNKRLKQKRLKWQLAISKKEKFVRRKDTKKTDYRHPNNKQVVRATPPEITINLLSDDDDDQYQQKPIITSSLNFLEQKNHDQLLPQIIVFPGHMQLSKVPNITLIPVKPLSVEAAANLQSRMRRKRKSQKPKRHAEPTIVNNESIVLSDDSNAGIEPTIEIPVASSTPNHLDDIRSNEPPLSTASSTSICPPPLSYFDTKSSSNLKNDAADLKISSVHSAESIPRNAMVASVDEEVTVSLVPRSSAAGSCNAQNNNTSELFPMVPDETTVQTIISNRIYELSLSKLREGLAESGVGEYADEQEKPIPTTSTRRKGTFNLPPKLAQPNLQPVSLKLSSDLSISLISDDDEDDQQQQSLKSEAEKLLRQQPHLSVRPVGHVVTMRQPPKRRKLG